MKAPAPSLALRLEGWRARFVLGAILLAFLALLGRALYLQGMNQDFLQAKGEARYGRIVEIPASRGAIADRNGSPLAISTPAESVWAAPQDVPDDNETRSKLAKALGMKSRDLNQKLADEDRTFVYLRRQMAPEEARKVLDLKVAGVFAHREFKRFYPQGEVMAHIVGFTGVDDRGQEGIELAHDKSLAGRSGSRRVIKDRKGRIVEDVENIRAPKEGGTLAITVDQRLQAITHAALRQAIDEHRAKGGAAVVLDAKTGEVLALSNQPDYNPNNRAKVTGAQTRNRSLTDLYEPGSTIKPFSIAAALEAGTVRAETAIATGGGTLQLGGHTINDTSAHGTLTVAEVLQKSSNVGTARIALQLPPERLWNLYRDLGFGQIPQTGFPGEAAGRLRPHSAWRPVEHATMSYGYGLSVSLLQMARAYTVWTNDGQLLPVSFVRRDWSSNTDVIGRQVVSPATAKTVAAMLEMAAGPGGTAPKAQIAGYRIAGKTGTARKHIAGGGYAEDRYVGSFVGYAPATAPRFIVAVMIDEPSAGKTYGGDVAAPVFAVITAKALALMGVTPDRTPAPVTTAKAATGREG
jgi:cell division protein FtsI (penicillin-binding protein 3)